MDPYLERHWRHVHGAIVSRTCDLLNRVLPADLAARSDARQYLEQDEEPIDSEPITESFVTVLEIQSERLVTIIEFLSPDNKHLETEGNRAYLRTRRQFDSCAANLVEINLSRRGDWRRIVGISIPPASSEVYCALVTRMGHASRREFYPIPLRQRLPVINIPLRQKEPDVHFDLQDLVDHVYISGRYASIDYSRSCDPPLDPDDAAWFAQLIKKK